MSNIPYARSVLQDALKHHDCADYRRAVRMALSHMTREPPARPAATARRETYTATHQAIRKFARANPDMTQFQIAKHFRIRNSRKVSRIISRKE